MMKDWSPGKIVPWLSHLGAYTLFTEAGPHWLGSFCWWHCEGKRQDTAGVNTSIQYASKLYHANTSLYSTS